MEQELTEETVRNGAADWYTHGGMKTIDVSHLPPEAVERIEEILRSYADAPRPPRAPFPLDWAKGKVEGIDSLLEPMSEEELKLWTEGHEGDPLRELH